jgi:MFS family permease
VRQLATRALVATTAIQIAAACAALTIPSIAPVIAADLGQPASMVGTYISVLYIGAAVAALASGGFVLRAGAIRLSQWCLGICAIGLLATLAIFAGSGLALSLMAAGALLIGCGYGPITPASSHVLAKSTPSHRMALTFSIKQTGVPAGAALAGLIVPPLTVAFGWPVAVAVVAAGCVAVALAAQPLRAPLDSDRDRAARLSVKALSSSLALVARERALQLMALVSFVYAGMQMSVSGFIVAYLHVELGLGLVIAGTALTAANLAGVVGRIVWGSVSDRSGSPRVVLAVIGLLMAGAAFAAALFSPQWPLAAIFAVAVVLGATAIGWNGVYLGEVARLAPAGLAGQATGGCLFFTFVGVVVIPFLFGWLQRMTGSYAVCFAAAGTVCAAIAILLLIARGPTPGLKSLPVQ